MTPHLKDWTIGVSEDEGCSWLCITGDSGESLAFRVERGSVRARMLQTLAIALANAWSEEAMQQMREPSDAAITRQAAAPAEGEKRGSHLK